MGFADQESRLMWGHVIADSLRELQAQDPALCYRALSGQARDPQALSHAFTADNTQAFQRAVVRIYESADEGLRHQRAAGDKPANFNETALEYRAIQNSVEQSFGPSVAAQISSRKFPESPADSPGQICAARIYQLEAMMERPKPAAAMLIDSALR
jgi:hypothetical protein